MPIAHSLVQRGLPGDATGPKKWYANARSRGITTERELTDKISRSTSLSSSDIKAAVESLLQEIPRELADGQIVQLGDLGSFRVTLQSEGTDQEDGFTAARVRKIKVNFLPSALFEQLLSGATLRRVAAIRQPRRRPPRPLKPARPGPSKIDRSMGRKRPVIFPPSTGQF